MPEPKQPDDDEPTPGARELIRAEFDWSDVPPSIAIIETVAIAANREPTGLEPLHETVDSDALDTLIRSVGTNSSDGDATVTFGFDGHEVTVQCGGSVVVRPDETRTKSE